MSAAPPSTRAEVAPAREAGRLRRLAVYFTTMFPLLVNVPTAAVIFFGAYATIGLAHGQAPLAGFPEALYGLVSVLLSLLLLRVFDELKDEAADAEVFPDRPLVTGAVRYSDVRLVGVAAMLALIALNLGRGPATDAFFVFFGGAVLSWQWWLFPERVSGSFPLLFATHQTLVPLLLAYVYCVFLDVNGGGADVLLAGAVCLVFWVPFIAWEIGRKVRAPEREGAYLTYTRRWGTRRAPAALIALMGLGALAMGALAFALQFSVGLVAVYGALAAACSLSVARFVARPTPERNHVRKAVEVYVFVFYAAPIVEWALTL